MAELIGLGLATLDHLMQVESFAQPVGQAKVKAFDIQGGGLTGTALVAAARLGLSVELWGVAGTDRLGDWIVAGLEAEGVGLQGFRRRDGMEGPLVLVFVDGETGERRFQLARWLRDADPYPLDLERLDGAKCLLVDGMFPRAAVEAARYARSRGIPVVADLGGVEGSQRELVSLVDYLVTNEDCARRVAGGSAGPDDPERACKLMSAMGPRVVVATLGGRGSVYGEGENISRQPAFPVSVVDTTGAGDCFHGAFCVGVVRGWGLGETVRFASAAAAIKCQRLGGRAGLPRMTEVEAFLRERGG
jgi:sugar/nucleoside kinase (ribokinase family)